MKLKFFIITIFAFVLFAGFSNVSNAQEVTQNNFKAKIIAISDEKCDETTCKRFTMEAITGEMAGNQIESLVVNPDSTDPQNKYLSVGDRVFVQEFKIVNDLNYVIVGPVREVPIFILIASFVILVLAVARFQGIGSIVGLGISIFALFGITTPMVLRGTNPIVAGYTGAIIILVSSIFLSHGITRKSIISFASSVLGLILISIITIIFVNLIKLSGYGADDAINLMSRSDLSLDMRGILFASIIIGGVGVLDDITMNQVSAIEQIFKADPKQSWQALFSKSMALGRDHISSLVNTLFIAYASASMPLVMVLQTTNSSFSQIINSDQFAEEIVRTIVASMGLVLVVPISSFLAAYIYSRRNIEETK